MLLRKMKKLTIKFTDFNNNNTRYHMLRLYQEWDMLAKTAREG